MHVRLNGFPKRCDARHQIVHARFTFGFIIMRVRKKKNIIIINYQYSISNRLCIFTNYGNQCSFDNCAGKKRHRGTQLLVCFMMGKQTPLRVCDNKNGTASYLWFVCSSHDEWIAWCEYGSFLHLLCGLCIFLKQTNLNQFNYRMFKI